MTMSAELWAFAREARDGAETLGLDPGIIDFRMASSDRIYELSAYALPVRPPHWTHGRDYWTTKQRFSEGQGRLYEIIFPEQNRHIAYLLEGNTIAAQKLVIAHCQGHADLDRHNVHLRGQDRYVEHIRLGTERILAYRQEYGAEMVEAVMDRAFPVQFQVAEDSPRPVVAPPSRHPLADILDGPVPSRRPRRAFHPTADVLGFIARESANLPPWARDVCEVLRWEGLYFTQMSRTKFLHEAWATWANQRLLLSVPMTAGDQVQSAQLLAGIISPSPRYLSPYAFGYGLLDYLLTQHDFATVQQIWYTETDAGLIRNYLTEDAMRALQLYRFRWDKMVGTTASGTTTPVWGAVRQPLAWEALRDDLANSFGQEEPRVMVEDVEGGTLILRHVSDGTNCDREWARKATQAVADLWGAPVRFLDGDWAAITATPVLKISR